MNVGLIGFGKTGKAVARTLIREEGINLKWVIRRSKIKNQLTANDILDEPSNSETEIFSINAIELNKFFKEKKVDVIIDFSSEDSIKIYGEVAAENGVIIVSAVSNYSDETIEYIKKLSEKTVTFWSPNITLGVNYILIISKFMKKIAPDIDIQIEEEHFKGKNEISGTAKVLANNLDVDNDEIKSIRAGGIVGKHEIIFGFPFQTVRLTHESISREAFGNGVIFVIKNIVDKEKGFYNYEELMKPFFEF